jgi:serine/threonine-protein kinase HipA
MSVHRCPITYQIIDEKQQYSMEGLRLLSRNLNTLAPLPFSAAELRQEAASRAQKMSIQGIQPKLSAVLNISKNCFDIVDNAGTFILKPSLDNYPEVPANEDLTMKMAAFMGIEVPLHGLLYDRDQTFTYFIKRFDRLPKKNKLPVEDFAQLSGKNRETKYSFSMEKIVPIIEQYCTFPMLEKHKLFIRVLFNYLVGNEDMHLKNFSLIMRQEKTELAPAYDFLNTTILLPHVKEELALSLNGKKSNLDAKDFIEYYAKERLSLSLPIIQKTLENFREKIPTLFNLIDISFLSSSKKESYRNVLTHRTEKLLST